MPSKAVIAARDTLAHWALRDRQRLASQPLNCVLAMEPGLQRALYIAIEEMLDDACDPCPVTIEPGLLPVFLDAQPHQEHRWQIASLISDVTVLSRPSWAPTFDFVTLREVVMKNYGSEPLVEPHEGAAAPSDSAPQRQLLGDWDNELDKILDLIEGEDEDDPFFPTPQRLARWRDDVLPPVLAKLLRFVVHVAAVGDEIDFRIVSPDLSSARDTVHSLKGVYWHEGHWYVADSWVGRGAPQGTRTFEEVLHDVGASWREIAHEVIGSYEVGSQHATGHIPLIPSSNSAHQAAVAFYSRFKRLHLVSPLVAGSPQAEPHGRGMSADWRPALCDQLVLTTFPGVATADLSTFERLHSLPRMSDFRSRLRADADRLGQMTAEETAARLEEISRELQASARDAARSMADDLTDGRKQVVLSGALNALVAGAGFISYGPIGAAVGAFCREAS